MIELGPQYALAQRLAEMERKIDWLTRRDVLQNASIDAGGLDVNDGAINVKSGQAINILNGGGMNVEGGGSINIQGGGAAYVNGLELSAVRAVVVQGWAQNYAVPTTPQTIVCTTEIAVPTGFTQALLFVNGQAEFYNQTATNAVAQGGLGAIPSTGNVTGNAPQMDIPVNAGVTNEMTGTLANVASGMSTAAGQKITVNGYVSSNVALAATAYNAFAISGIAIFLA